MIPPGAAIRVVGDVHGDARAFAIAADTDRFVVQLGDLTDHGPDSAGALDIAFRMLDEGRGVFLLGNHDWKLWRALAGRNVRRDAALEATLTQLNEARRARVLETVVCAPAWLRCGDALFVHGGFHTAMLEHAPPLRVLRADALVARALYGEPTGRIQPDGYPERSLRWVDRIPSGITVYCGHDNRSPDGRPAVRHGRDGGHAVFLDTGAGKGGHLSWLDLPAP